MTQDEIMQLAKDAGLRIDVRGTYFFIGFGELSDLLDSAITKEREACANLCWKNEDDNAFVNHGGKRLDLLCAELIKARGEE